LIEIFVDGLKKMVLDHPKTRKDSYEIHLNDMSSSSIDIMFYIFFEADTWSAELKAKHEILLAIIKLAKSIGVNFAFPTQTLHMETFPEKRGKASRGSAPWASIKSGFLLAPDINQQQQLILDIEVPDRIELYPFKLELTLNGEPAHTMEIPAYKNKGIHRIEVDVPIQMTAAIEGKSPFLEIMLFTQQYFTGITDHRMKSFRLLSAKLENTTP